MTLEVSRDKPPVQLSYWRKAALLLGNYKGLRRTSYQHDPTVYAIQSQATCPTIFTTVSIHTHHTLRKLNYLQSSVQTPNIPTLCSSFLSNYFTLRSTCVPCPRKYKLCLPTLLIAKLNIWSHPWILFYICLSDPSTDANSNHFSAPHHYKAGASLCLCRLDHYSNLLISPVVSFLALLLSIFNKTDGDSVKI